MPKTLLNHFRVRLNEPAKWKTRTYFRFFTRARNSNFVIAALFTAIILTQAEIGFSEAGVSKESTKTELFPEKISLDGKDYSRQDLLTAFKSAAFSNTFFGSRGTHEKLWQSPLGGKGILFDENTFKVQYPWLYEHVFHPNGMPRYAAINKWRKSISISIGYPFNLTPATEPANAADYLYDEYASGAEGKKTEAEKVAQDELERIIPRISNLTKLDITFVPQSKETAKDYANIRVVFVDKPDDWKSKFKRGFFMSSMSGGGHMFRASSMWLLDAAVPFTPYSEYQLDGFLLPNSKNEIDMAFCFIPREQSEQMLRRFIQECMVRSMGFPDSTKVSPNSILATWNDPKRALTNEGYKETGVSDFDAFLISRMYSKEIESGMSIHDLNRKLF